MNGVDQFTRETYEKMGLTRNTPQYTNPYFWWAEFDRFRKFLPFGKILELGCGGGRDAKLLTGLGYGYVGIDYSSTMIESAKAFVKADFRLMPMDQLDFAEGEFDGFWAASSLIHVPRQNLEDVLKGVARVVKPSGVGLMVMHPIPSDGAKESYLESEHGFRYFAYYTDKELSNILDASGFNVAARFDSRKITPRFDRVYPITIVKKK